MFKLFFLRVLFSLSIIDPVKHADAGMYQCEATNIFGTVLSEYANVTFGG